VITSSCTRAKLTTIGIGKPKLVTLLAMGERREAFERVCSGKIN
jgi:hypothetical protein